MREWITYKSSGKYSHKRVHWITVCECLWCREAQIADLYSTWYSHSTASTFIITTHRVGANRQQKQRTKQTTLQRFFFHIIFGFEILVMNIWHCLYRVLDKKDDIMTAKHVTKLGFWNSSERSLFRHTDKWLRLSDKEDMMVAMRQEINQRVATCTPKENNLCMSMQVNIKVLC